MCVCVCVCVPEGDMLTQSSLYRGNATRFQTLGGQTGSGHKNIVKVVLQPALEMDLTPPSHTPKSVQFSSVAQLCPILYDPMNCNTPK